MQIRDLFASDIHRRIEEVIKVDQADEEILHGEIEEYVVTDAIRRHYADILRLYWETPNKPHEGTAIWISGFFGSGKSSFAKMLGVAIENRTVRGEGASQLFGQRTGDSETQVLLKQIVEHIPTEAVIFDVSTDRGIKSGNQTITEIMYRLFLKSLGYADDLDLAELEITLEQKGALETFEATYREMFNQDWNQNKDLIAFSLGEASTVMSKLYPDRYSATDSWVQSVQDRADITPGKLAERCKELMDRRRPGRTLLFVVDEVGQFVARDVQKMLDLQAVVQSLGRVGRGRMWLTVTSQEKLSELVGGLDEKRVELARLMDRFPLQVHLEPSDISEVTSRRVLSKNAQAETELRQLYQQHSGRLHANTKLTADIRLPELTAERFVDLYPLLPYQIDLIINVVSGLRTEGGASKHVGGANRTIIKLAQQLLIHDAVDLAGQAVGSLARIDQIYDLVAGNIASEVRGKIAAIRDEVAHPMAQPVAKAICLLQYAQSIHRTAENIAAVLHPGVAADSVLPEVKAALEELAAAHKVRLADGQYRIPTPAEDDWEVTRAGFNPKPGDTNRIHADIVGELWEPKPSHSLLDVKAFKGGMVLGGRAVTDGDIDFHVTLAESGPDFDREAAEARKRSQSEPRSVFWVARLDDPVDRRTVEVFRSREILSRKERAARTKVETALVAEEKRRQKDHESELRRLVKEALLTGVVYFRGNDRSPDETATTVSQAASRILGQILPDVFHRFAEGAARITSKELEAVLTNENLRGLPSVFHHLKLLEDQNGQPVFATSAGSLQEVLSRIENRTSYGEAATGRYLADEFAKEPFGWSLDVVRLFVVCLVRAGKLKAKSKGVAIESALSVEARTSFTSNNLFKACSFEPQGPGTTTIEDWLEAEEAFRRCFGEQIPDVTNAAAVAHAIRGRLASAEEQLHSVHSTLLRDALPGRDTLQDAIDQVRGIRAGSDDDAILGFNNTHKGLRDALQRAADLEHALTEPRLADLRRACTVMQSQWPFLQAEQDISEELRESAESLADLLARETFYRELPSIEQLAGTIQAAYKRRLDEAAKARADAYQSAIETLKAADGWHELSEEQQTIVAEPLASRAAAEVVTSTSIPFLRSERDACGQHLKHAIQQMHEATEGNLLVTVEISEFFPAKVANPEQLEAALSSLRQRVEKLIGEGKKVLVR